MKKVVFSFIISLFLFLFLTGCNNKLSYKNNEFLSILYHTNDKEIGDALKNGTFSKSDFLDEYSIDNVSYIIYDKDSFSDVELSQYYECSVRIFIFLDKKTDREFDKMIKFFSNHEKKNHYVTIYNNKNIKIKGDKYE